MVTLTVKEVTSPVAGTASRVGGVDWNQLITVLKGTHATEAIPAIALEDNSLTNTQMATGVFAAITGLGVQTQSLDMDAFNIHLNDNSELELGNVAGTPDVRILYDATDLIIEHEIGTGKTIDKGPGTHRFQVEGASIATIRLNDSGGGADQKLFEIERDGDTTKLQKLTDAEAAVPYITFNHNAQTMDFNSRTVDKLAVGANAWDTTNFQFQEASANTFTIEAGIANNPIILYQPKAALADISLVLRRTPVGDANFESMTWASGGGGVWVLNQTKAGSGSIRGFDIQNAGVSQLQFNGAGTLITAGVDLDMSANDIIDIGSLQTTNYTIDEQTGALVFAHGSGTPVLKIKPDGSGNALLSIYKTTDLVTNTERINLLADAVSFNLDVNQAGTGVLRTFNIRMAGNSLISFNTDNSMNFNSRLISSMKLGANADAGGFGWVNAFGMDGRTSDGVLTLRSGLLAGQIVLQTRNAADVDTTRIIVGGGANTVDIDISNAEIDMNNTLIRNLNNIQDTDSEITKIKRTASSSNVALTFENDTALMTIGIDNGEDFGVATSSDINATKLFGVDRTGDIIFNATNKLFIDGVLGVGGNSYITESSGDVASFVLGNVESMALGTLAMTMSVDIDMNGNDIDRFNVIARGGTDSSSGVIRLKNNEAIGWRDSGDTADHTILLDATDVLRINLGGTTTLGNTTNFGNTAGVGAIQGLRTGAGAALRLSTNNASTVQTARLSISSNLNTAIVSILDADLDMGGNDIILDADADLIIDLSEDDTLEVKNTTNTISLRLQRDEIIADGQVVGQLIIRGQDDGGADTVYTRLESRVNSDVAGAEDGAFKIKVLENAVEVTYMDFFGGNADIDVFKDLDMAADIKMGGNDIFTEAGKLDFTSFDIFDQGTTLGLESTVTNSALVIQARPNGTSTSTQMRFMGTNSIATNYERLIVGTGFISGPQSVIQTMSAGTGTTRPLGIYFDTTKVLEITSAALITLADAVDIAFNATTGTKIGTAGSQKLAFYGATPTIQLTGVAVTAAGIHAALVTLGLITA